MIQVKLAGGAGGANRLKVQSGAALPEKVTPNTLCLVSGYSIGNVTISFTRPDNPAEYDGWVQVEPAAQGVLSMGGDVQMRVKGCQVYAKGAWVKIQGYMAVMDEWVKVPEHKYVFNPGNLQVYCQTAKPSKPGVWVKTDNAVRVDVDIPYPFDGGADVIPVSVPRQDYCGAWVYDGILYSVVGPTNDGAGVTTTVGADGYTSEVSPSVYAKFRIYKYDISTGISTLLVDYTDTVIMEFSPALASSIFLKHKAAIYVDQTGIKIAHVACGSYVNSNWYHGMALSIYTVSFAGKVENKNRKSLDCISHNSSTGAIRFSLDAFMYKGAMHIFAYGETSYYSGGNAYQSSLQTHYFTIDLRSFVVSSIGYPFSAPSSGSNLFAKHVVCGDYLYRFYGAKTATNFNSMTGSANIYRYGLIDGSLLTIPTTGLQTMVFAPGGATFGKYIYLVGGGTAGGANGQPATPTTTVNTITVLDTTNNTFTTSPLTTPKGYSGSPVIPYAGGLMVVDSPLYYMILKTNKYENGQVMLFADQAAPRRATLYDDGLNAVRVGIQRALIQTKDGLIGVPAAVSDDGKNWTEI